MAAGVEHRAASRAAVIPTSLVAYLATGDMFVAAAAGAGMAFGIVCNPDLDLSQITIAERTMVQKIGAIGWLWLVIWWPYAKLVPHRHWISHSVAGTFIRLSYLAALAWLLGFDVWAVLMTPAGISFCCGLLLSDILHLVMDGAAYKAVKRATGLKMK